MPNTDKKEKIPNLSRRFHQGLAALHPLTEQDLKKIGEAVAVEHSNAKQAAEIAGVKKAIQANESGTQNTRKSGPVRIRVKPVPHANIADVILEKGKGKSPKITGMPTHKRIEPTAPAKSSTEGFKIVKVDGLENVVSNPEANKKSQK